MPSSVGRNQLVGNVIALKPGAEICPLATHNEMIVKELKDFEVRFISVIQLNV